MKEPVTVASGRAPPSNLSPVAALVLGWVIPGAGHAYGGNWGKAVLFFALITGLLVGGMAMGGGTVLLPDRLWYAAQVCAGGPALAMTPLAQYVARRPPPADATPAYNAVAPYPGIDWADHLHETGTLYTAVAGFLNLLVMMDAYLRLAYPDRHGRKEIV